MSVHCLVKAGDSTKVNINCYLVSPFYSWSRGKRGKVGRLESKKVRNGGEDGENSHRWGKIEEDVLPAADRSAAKEKREEDQAAVVSGSIRAMFLK
jgi:hypothetical protein